MRGWVKQSDSAAMRYAPAAILFLCAIIVSFFINGDGGMRNGSPDSIGKDSPIVFKSPHRHEREIPSPARRAPLKASEADSAPLTLEEGRKMIADSRELGRPSSRGRIVTEVIRRLNASGFSEEAFLLIEQEPSDARIAGIAAFFESAPLDEKNLMERIKGFQNPADAVAALSVYLRRIPAGQISAFIDREESLHPFLQAALTEYLNKKLDSDPERPQALAMMDGLHAKGLLSDELVLRRIVEDRDSDPFQRLNELNARIPTDNPRFMESCWILIGQMTEKDPEKTTGLAWEAGKRKNIGGPNHMLRSVISDWAVKDPGAATAWYQARVAEFSPAQKDDAAEAFGFIARDLGRRGEAAEWIAKVGDPEMKRWLSSMLGVPASPDFGR